MNDIKNPPLEVIILAAGQGTRMYSSKPKVLHTLGGKVLLRHVVDTAKKLAAASINVVYGHGGEQVKSLLANESLNWCEQAEQLGTGHAVQQAINYISDESEVLILYGDVPLLSPTTLNHLLSAKQQHKIALLSANLDDPSGYGRIVRDSNNVIQKIIEEKEADEEIKSITEINSGVMAVSGQELKKWLSQLDNNNAQNEYYLTDVIELAVKEGEIVASYIVADDKEIEGINNKNQLAALEREYQLRNAYELMAKGVTLMDPARFDLRGSLETGQDVHIDVNVIIEGNCQFGNNVRIGANSIIKNTIIADNVTILENCVIERATIAAECNVGPFSRLRPETKLAEKTKVGNFVEIKKSTIAAGSKVNHLSYIGDTLMGENVNIGAGTITCNYDGANKYVTKIGDNVFIGSNSALVAPLEIGANATIGAGTTLSNDAEKGKLTLARVKQRTIQGWKRPVKNK
jgi:bifunctional UDP-N-acetylglucosamine pyrophosphorylase/glucosamine-1-phosphate N-acetyltransferase